MNKYSDIKLRSAQSNQFFPEIPGLSSKNYSEVPQSFDNFLFPLSYSNSRISSFTVVENQRVRKYSNTTVNSPYIKNTIDEDKILYNSKKNLLELIKRLDIREVHEKKIMYENEIVDVELDHGLFKSFHIPCKDKRTPLRVYIRKKYGKVQCFFSRTVEKPNETSHDLVFHMDNFEINDFSSKFTFDWAYLNIQALSKTEFSVSISFSKDRPLFVVPETKFFMKSSSKKIFDDLRKNEDMRRNLTKRVKKLLKKRKKETLMLAGQKNFLQINKNATISILEKLPNNWTEKKEIVNKRKTEIRLEKIENAKKRLNRKFFLLQAEEIQKTEHEAKEKSMKIQKFWISLIFLLNSSSIIHKLCLEKRNIKILKLQEVASVRLIQKVFKKSFVALSVQSKTLQLCRNSLLVYQKLSKQISKSSTKTILVNFISHSAHNNHVAAVFKTFFKKLTSIQKSVKVYIFKKNARINEIIKIWNKVMLKLTSKHSTVLVTKYIKITSHQRNEAVRQYFKQRLTEYLNKLKSLKEINNDTRYQTALSMKLKKSIKAKSISFEYLPTEFECKEMIDKLINES